MTKEGANKSMQELHQTEMDGFPNMKVRAACTARHCCAVQIARWSSLDRCSLKHSSVDSSFKLLFLATVALPAIAVQEQVVSGQHSKGYDERCDPF